MATEILAAKLKGAVDTLRNQVKAIESSLWYDNERDLSDIIDVGILVPCD